MNHLEDLLEDYARAPVPAEKTVQGLHLGLMVIGVMITVTAFMLGSQLGEMLGFARAISGIALGAIVLTLISAATGSVGAITHLSTSMINRYTFGTSGALIVNSLLGLTALGWYSVVIAVFGAAAVEALRELNLSLPVSAATIIGSALAVSITIFGFKALDKMALAAVPAMLLFLFVVLYLSTRDLSLQAILTAPGSSSDLGVGGAASLIVGSFIVGSTLFPDISRYARSIPHVWLGAIVSYSFGYVIVLSLAMIPSIATGERNLITIIGLVGLNGFGFVLLLFSTLTTVTYNLYSGSLAAAALKPRTAKWKLVIFLGVITTTAAVFRADKYFIDWIAILSLAIPPIGGVYTVDWLVVRRHRPVGEPPEGFVWSALVSCFIGSGIAYLTYIEVLQLTTVPAVDAMFSAALSYHLASKVFKRRREPSGTLSEGPYEQV